MISTHEVLRQSILLKKILNLEEEKNNLFYVENSFKRPRKELIKKDRKGVLYSPGAFSSLIGDFYALLLLLDDFPDLFWKFKSVVVRLQIEIAYAILMSATGESRHSIRFLGTTSSKTKFLDKTLKSRKFKAFLSSSIHHVDDRDLFWNFIATNSFSDSELLLLLDDLILILLRPPFNDPKKQHTYCGPLWAEGVFLLKDFILKKYNSIIFIDRSIDLEHNGGSYFNKLPGAMSHHSKKHCNVSGLVFKQLGMSKMFLTSWKEINKEIPLYVSSSVQRILDIKHLNC